MIQHFSFFLLMGLAILLAWTCRYKQQSLYVFLCAIIAGVIQGYITLPGLLVIAVLGTTHYLLNNQQINVVYRILLHMMLIFIFVGFTYHLLPGFNNWRLIDQVRLSPMSFPYTMYLNVEQLVYGYFFLFFYAAKNKTIDQPWTHILRWGIIAFLGTLIGLLIANYFYPLVAWDPKPLDPLFATVWIIRMVLSVCLAEEVFFRGYLQALITRLFAKYASGSWAAYGISAVLFGLLHLPAGLPMAIMATLAGLGYGYAYLKTQCIESAIITHFLLNLTHLLLFSYPMLANSL